MDFFGDGVHRMQMMKMEKRWKKEERETTSMWALRFKGDTIIQVG